MEVAEDMAVPEAAVLVVPGVDMEELEAEVSVEAEEVVLGVVEDMVAPGAAVLEALGALGADLEA